MTNKTEVFKVQKNRNFTIINNEILRRDDISWKAKGIMCYLLSLPSDWTINLTEIMKHATDGEASFRTGWKELSKLGYVERRPVRKDKKIDYWETIIWESLELKKNQLLGENQEVGESKQNQLLGEKLHVENQHVENLHVGNQVLLSTNNTKDLNNKGLIYSAFEKAWKEYPLKKGKNAVNKKNKEAIEKLGEEKILQAVRNYTKDIAHQRANGFKDLNYMNGSTFFNGRYEDYLDESSITPLKPGSYVQDTNDWDGLDLGMRV